jgi:hypothetical protein
MDTPGAPVRLELAPYRSTDRGLGRALEPDLRTLASRPVGAMLLSRCSRRSRRRRAGLRPGCATGSRRSRSGRRPIIRLGGSDLARVVGSGGPDDVSRRRRGRGACGRRAANSIKGDRHSAASMTGSGAALEGARASSTGAFDSEPKCGTGESRAGLARHLSSPGSSCASSAGAHGSALRRQSIRFSSASRSSGIGKGSLAPCRDGRMSS